MEILKTEQKLEFLNKKTGSGAYELHQTLGSSFPQRIHNEFGGGRSIRGFGNSSCAVFEISEQTLKLASKMLYMVSYGDLLYSVVLYVDDPASLQFWCPSAF